MYHIEQLKAEGIDAYLKSHEQKQLLRFITCGSVDDGKSTLIGRLLYESKLIYEDQLAAVHNDSVKMGTQGGGLDLALLVDGLAAEREQGITIDVAYRYFSTQKRKFIVADTPGHEQYTRNMATGASTATAAIVLLDARKGVLNQTRRHTYICSLLGIRHLIFAINKMDLVDFSREVFEEIRQAVNQLTQRVGAPPGICIPLSALKGDNVVERSSSTPWYDGVPLLELLETLPVDDQTLTKPFRLPVQWVNRPSPDFRGFSGCIASGKISRGDEIIVLPSAKRSIVADILGADGSLEQAIAGQSVTITLTDEVDVSRGDVLSEVAARPTVADQFKATIVWMHEEPMLPGRPYLLKIGTRTVTVSISEPRHKMNINTLEELAARTLELNDIGVCNISVDRPIAFDPYKENRDMGGFIIIDRLTNNTVGAGMLEFSLWRSENVHWQALDVNKQARATLKHQRPCIIWFTGLSGSGKSTIANALEKRLHAGGHHTYILDGDNVRHGLNKDLGFTDADRVENIRRVVEVAKLMVDAGLIVMVSFISPFRSERLMARESVESGEFIEVFVDTPIVEAERRDPKGLYEKARQGKLKHFTGIDSPYEAPENPELTIDTLKYTPLQSVELIWQKLKEIGRID
jgi:bifunctional enzyme CysN/CysC